MRSAAPPRLAVACARTWLAPGLLGLDISRITGEPCSGQSTRLPPSPPRLLWRKSSLVAHHSGIDGYEAGSGKVGHAQDVPGEALWGGAWVSGGAAACRESSG